MSEQPKTRRTARAAAQANAPWLPVSYEPADAVAMQALTAGEATDIQQRRALDWIIRCAAATYDMPYRPGDDGRRDTDFALGRAFVGQQIVKLTRLNVSRGTPNV